MVLHTFRSWGSVVQEISYKNSPEKNLLLRIKSFSIQYYDTHLEELDLQHSLVLLTRVTSNVSFSP